MSSVGHLSPLSVVHNNQRWNWTQTKDSVILQNESKVLKYPFSHMIAVTKNGSSLKRAPEHFSFVIHFLIPDKWERLTHYFECQSEEEVEQAIDNLLPWLYPKTERKLMVFINPYSGSKDARASWNEIRSLLRLANFTLHTLETERGGQVKERILNLPQEELLSYYALVTVSGDGLVHELINGLLSRSDRDVVSSVPISPIPAGSGNGVAHSVGSINLLAAAYNIIKGTPHPLDISRILLYTPKKKSLQERESREVFSCLQISWAIVADVEHQSEQYRWLGPVRIPLVGVYQIFFPVVHKGRLSIHTISPYNQPQLESNNLQQEGRQSSQQLQQQRQETQKITEVPQDDLFKQTMTHLRQKGQENLPLAERKPTKTSTEVLQQRIHRPGPFTGSSSMFSVVCGPGCELCQLSAADEKFPSAPRSHVGGGGVGGEEEVSEEKVAAGSSSSSSLEVISSSDASSLVSSSPASLWSWKEQKVNIEGQVTFLMSCSLAWADMNTFMAPYAHLNDGKMDVTLMQHTSIWESLNMFLRFDKGTHIWRPMAQYYKATHWSLEVIPEGSVEILDVDGELFEFTACDVKVLPGQCRILRRTE